MCFSPFIWCKTESVLNLGENVTSEEMEELYKWERHRYLNNHNPQQLFHKCLQKQLSTGKIENLFQCSLIKYVIIRSSMPIHPVCKQMRITLQEHSTMTVKSSSKVQACLFPIPLPTFITWQI